MMFNGAGNVGIGTNDPSYPLDIRKSSQSGGQYYFNVKTNEGVGFEGNCIEGRNGTGGSNWSHLFLNFYSSGNLNLCKIWWKRRHWH